jgi:hypothetical protein
VSDDQLLQPNMGVAADITQRPDGEWWVTVSFVTELNMVTLWFPTSISEQFTSNLTKAVDDASRNAKRKNSGLIVPGQ